LRIRQRPGPKNSLGLAKFIFPNDDNVYLHGTPAQELFARSRRDFSHGCVRVENPPALAQWLLKDQPAWGAEQIAAAMNGTRTQQVNLSAPVPVILYYLTAAVSPDDGLLHFADDLYGHDAALDRALKARRAR
jgi:murein L,D-transpeptidase YcbB/YkuD